MTAPFVPLRSSTPSAEGVDAAGIRRFVEALDARPDLEPHGLMLLRHGRTIAQGWWAPYSRDRPQLVYSLSKSFTSAAAGLLYDDGVLDLDRPVVSYFPEFADDITDPRSRRILVRHVASMASGHLDDMYDAAMATDPDEPVRGFLLNPPEREPGTVFAYNQLATYTLAAIVQRLAGRRLVELLRERVLDPIGAGDVRWLQHPEGRDIGYSGSFMTTDTIARLGQLLLRRGEWDGRRILSEEWVRLATTPQISNAGQWGNGPDSDWTQGYGFQHWMARHGYRGDGAYGQFCIVLPEHDVVLGVQGEIPDMQGLLDLAWEHLLPAFAGAGSAEDDARLAEMLAAASLPRVAGVADAPDDADAAADAPDDADDADADAPAWDGATFAPSRSDGIGAAVRQESGVWHATLAMPGGEVDVAFATDGSWVVTERSGPAVGTSARFASSGTLLLDLVFLETPHRLHVALERDAATGAGTATTWWQTEPLHGVALATLAAPPA